MEREQYYWLVSAAPHVCLHHCTRTHPRAPIFTGARVADGAKADWYFIPVRLRSSSDAYVLQRAIHHLRHAHPWFNATGGGRHFVIAVGGWAVL